MPKAPLNDLFIASDNLIEYVMFDALSQTYINDAEVTYELKDAEDVIASGSLPYVALSNGEYAGVIEGSSLLLDPAGPLIVGGEYHLEITAESGSINDFRRIKVTARYRGAV